MHKHTNHMLWAADDSQFVLILFSTNMRMVDICSLFLSSPLALVAILLRAQCALFVDDICCLFCFWARLSLTRADTRFIHHALLSANDSFLRNVQARKHHFIEIYFFSVLKIITSHQNSRVCLLCVKVRSNHIRTAQAHQILNKFHWTIFIYIFLNDHAFKHYNCNCYSNQMLFIKARISRWRSGIPNISLFIFDYVNYMRNCTAQRTLSLYLCVCEQNFTCSTTNGRHATQNQFRR